jgi:anti-sigma regulatory factor (Ser/Thr protein kinase)
MSVEPKECRSPNPAVVVAGSAAGLRHAACQLIRDELGWAVGEADSQAAAFELLRRTEPLIVVAELVPSGWPGPDFFDALRERFPEVSVVALMTDGAEAATLRVLQRGVAGYASSAHLESELLEPLERVASAARASRDRRRLRSCLTNVALEFNLENDLQMVSTLIAEVQEQLALLGYADRSGRVRLGVALEEALLNGMIHGNLEIASSVKQQSDALYRQAIEDRRTRPPYRERRLRFRARMNRDKARFRVQDQGPGFDPQCLPDPTDAANLEKVSGRGLLLIQTFMDEVTFNRRGNAITMTKRLR